MLNWIISKRRKNKIKSKEDNNNINNNEYKCGRCVKEDGTGFPHEVFHSLPPTTIFIIYFF